MEVKLLSGTHKPLEKMFLAAKRCVVCGDIDGYRDCSRTTMQKVVETCISSGHLSICETVNFIFLVSGIEVSTATQFTRHRHFSFWQRSGRRNVIGAYDEAVKAFVAFHSKKQDVATGIVSQYFKISKWNIEPVVEGFYYYHKALREGASIEEARRCLVQSEYTELMASCNFRALIETSQLRLCGKAEEPIRTLFFKIREVVGKTGNDGRFLCKYLQPKCVLAGRCNEKFSCGFINAKEIHEDITQ